MRKLSLREVAVLIDTEGYIGISKQKKTHRVSIQLGMTASVYPRLLLEAYGGSYCKEKGRTVRHKDVYRWSLSTRDAARLLSKVLPFLLIKKKQALLGIKFARRLQKRHSRKGHRGFIALSSKEVLRREHLMQACLRLNKRGPIEA